MIYTCQDCVSKCGEAQDRPPIPKNSLQSCLLLQWARKAQGGLNRSIWFSGSRSAEVHGSYSIWKQSPTPEKKMKWQVKPHIHFTDSNSFRSLPRVNSNLSLWAQGPIIKSSAEVWLISTLSTFSLCRGFQFTGLWFASSSGHNITTYASFGTKDWASMVPDCTLCPGDCHLQLDSVSVCVSLLSQLQTHWHS